MAKLNNSGWGIGVMIGFIVVFILFLLVVAFLIYHVDNEKDSEIQLMEEEFILLNE